MRRENVLGRIQPYERNYEVARGCVNRIHLWPLRRDDHSGVLIGAGGTRRSDWPARVLTNDISTRIDQYSAGKE